MQTGAITSYFDVAQITLYAFWIFFAGLILYLRSEDKREGYPLISETPGGESSEGWPAMPAPKTYLLPHGGTLVTPRPVPRETPKLVPGAIWPGYPMEPTGDPMLDGVGPAAYADRADEPDLMFEGAVPKIVPLRTAKEFFLAPEDPDPRGSIVVGADDEVAGTVSEVWVDKAEFIVRFLEVELAGAGGQGRVLLPMGFADIRAKQSKVRVSAILAAQFARVPRLRNPDVITNLEEDKISAYYAGGTLYATPERLGPIL